MRLEQSFWKIPVARSAGHRNRWCRRRGKHRDLTIDDGRGRLDAPSIVRSIFIPRSGILLLFGLNSVERILLDAAVLEYPVILTTPLDGGAEEAAHKHRK
jgi:hypothetical protein